MQKSHDDVVAAKTVLIIGGGAVGVELAGQFPSFLHHSCLVSLCYRLHACLLLFLFECLTARLSEGYP